MSDRHPNDIGPLPSQSDDDLRKQIYDIADRFYCNGPELWSEIEKLFYPEHVRQTLAMLEGLREKKKAYPVASFRNGEYEGSGNIEAVPLAVLDAEISKLRGKQ